MSRFYFIAVALVIGLIAAAICWDASSLAFFFDAPSLIVVIAPVLAMCLAVFSPREIGRSFRAAWGGGEEQDLRAACVFFRALERYFLLSGLLGVLMGVISMLAATGSDADMKRGFAMLLISIFYALTLLLVFAVPFRTAVEKNLAEAAGKQE